ncbi:metal-sulfur cluster assembly factor [candidate division KSB1 bacterium]
MVTKEQVMETLEQCKDPEIPMVSIVDLGLVYDVEVKDDVVDVKMTLTTPGCGMAMYIANDAKQKIESMEGVTTANVGLVWDPPWTPDRIKPEVKKRLGFS